MLNYTPAADLLKDRIILVTGAGDGIGAAAAKSFAAHGATVVLLGRAQRKLEVIYDAIEQAGHPQPAIYPLNLEGAAPQDYQNLADVLAREFGRLDGLLHNAGQLGTLTPLDQYDLEVWQRVLQINMQAPYLMTRALMPLLRAAADASVLFTSAEVGRKGRAYWGAYAVAAAATENLMQIWADELETNTQVRVNTIDPGPVRTTLRARAYPGEDPEIHPRPEAILTPYLYLMGPDSRGVTGQQFSAQGE